MIGQAKQQISDSISNIEPQINGIKERIEQKASDIQVRIRKTQSRGVMGLFRAQEKAATTLHKTADKWPSKLPDNIKKELESFGDKLLASSVEEWTDMNAKTAIKASRDLGLMELLRVRRYEERTKNRKTVLRALNTRIEKHENGILN